MMLSREQLEVPVGHPEKHYDVIVAGGGPAGLGAALASSMMGAKTLLIEARGFLGGVAANSLWMPINRIYLNGGHRGAVHTALADKIKSFGPDAYRKGRESWIDGDGLHVHPDFLRLATLELLEDYHCDYLLFSPVTSVTMKDDRIQSITASFKTQKDSFSADAYIDCTGDGDLSYLAGAATEYGRDGDGATMFVTLGFAVANVDTEKMFDYWNTEQGRSRFMEIINLAEEDGFAVSYLYNFDPTTIPGMVSVNHQGLKNIGVLHATSPREITIAERGNLQLAHDFIKIMKKYNYPGMEHCILGRTGAFPGVRETRRVMCDYVLTLEDAATAPEFPDIIARRYGGMDTAGLTQDRDRPGSMVNGYGFPYRGLLVSGIEALLAAGRCGSYTHDGLAAGKSMGNMMELGQAAGVAAALAVSKHITPRQLPYGEVQAVLRKWGTRL